MIKKIYECGSVPLSTLALALVLLLFVVTELLGAGQQCTETVDILGIELSPRSIGAGILVGALLLFIPIAYRTVLRDTSILDFNERISLYPISLLLLTAMPSCNRTAILLIAVILIGLLAAVLSLKEGESPSRVSFAGGVLIALTAWVSPYFLFLAPFLWVAIGTLHELSWRAIVWSLLGLLAPVYLYLTVGYIVTGIWPHIDYQGLLVDDPSVLDGTIPLTWIIYLVVILSISVFMLLRSLGASGKGTVRRRKIIRLSMILLALMLVISVLLFSTSGISTYLGLVAVPLAMVFQEMYRKGDERIFNGMFILWLICTVAVALV